ncbi:hypothetical protein AK812_SmicGene45688 [Symbiodinium microadriaticum]|uniref:Uncharacterized protein n=1 Tax=Symbiodinium microadriaticum TaxID=2951 RepID=A0A1Q9BVT4_SYMMI|nr:hypothetical protein AK812_SmicGene45688 [Symbiodinium microadriaticum]
MGPQCHFKEWLGLSAAVSDALEDAYQCWAQEDAGGAIAPTRKESGDDILQYMAGFSQSTKQPAAHHQAVQQKICRISLDGDPLPGNATSLPNLVKPSKCSNS